ncbi:hypothetical protein [Natronobacterium gregoryi]|uniref:DUF8149 domain-containing protein n=2 Tax=Natronobacterium gregoryi TaxID=44930 RepID=L0AMI4_NATGS|nr:hypothetical protein [Natronobacterium gregoryi]AFZ74407.1 hypothetical protein Natgr_3281 [Natronobacterium gregoryi SP2]ELY72133.1 hypothetical protein C490_04237 [Natronobacterium gregoryi SP2]PLK19737.1 hypothetical protein CYV19_13090 [Natronobacterium gregoryi SP2]SFJ40368.1 hypothetical protein SAMN05443661_1278 [Natronobacterium gregoryi]
MPPSDSAGDEPRVPVVCPDCETTSRVPLSDLADSIDRHNEQLHDGDEVAEVDPDVADSLADLIATDLGLFEDEDHPN